MAEFFPAEHDWSFYPGDRPFFSKKLRAQVTFNYGEVAIFANAVTTTDSSTIAVTKVGSGGSVPGWSWMADPFRKVVGICAQTTIAADASGEFITNGVTDCRIVNLATSSGTAWVPNGSALRLSATAGVARKAAAGWRGAGLVFAYAMEDQPLSTTLMRVRMLSWRE